LGGYWPRSPGGSGGISASPPAGRLILGMRAVSSKYLERARQATFCLSWSVGTLQLIFLLAFSQPSPRMTDDVELSIAFHCPFALRSGGSGLILCSNGGSTNVRAQFAVGFHCLAAVAAETCGVISADLSRSEPSQRPKNPRQGPPLYTRGAYMPAIMVGAVDTCVQPQDE